MTIIESRAHVITSPSSVYKRLEFQNALMKTAKAATKDPFSIKAFEDTEVHWLFEIERGRKTVQILAVASGKVMNI